MPIKGRESGQILLTYWLFVWSFGEHMLLVFNPQPYRALFYAFALLPPIIFFLYNFKQAAGNAFKRVYKAISPAYRLTVLALLLMLSWPYRLQITSWAGILSTAAFRTVSIPPAALSLACFLMLSYIKRRFSIWPFLVFTTLAEMLVFSYVMRTWNLLVPLHFAAAVSLQYTLHSVSSRRNLLSLQVEKESNEHEKPQEPLTRAALGRRWGQPAWVVLLIVVSVSLGSSFPALSPIWFRGITTLGSIQGNLGNGSQVRNNSVFAWETEHLGGPWQGDGTPLFYVQSPEPVYWRSLIFDYYANGRWLHRDNYSQLHSSPPLQFAACGHPFNCQVCLLQPLAIGTGLVLPPNTSGLVRISAPDIRFDYNTAVDTLLADSVLGNGVSYTVTACEQTYSADSLRKVSSLYNPPIVTGMPQNPLVLKDAQTVKQLALSITAAAPTPYDKLQALNSYLKSNMRYTYQPSPPPDSDFVSDFLLRTHEGYCLHFASSLAVMANMLGYPSRLVMGFTDGRSLPGNAANPFPDQDRSTVRVLTREDAHSWAEVYFPGYGWIPFDATPGFSNPDEPYEAAQTAAYAPVGNSPSASPQVKKNMPDPGRIDNPSGAGGGIKNLSVNAGFAAAAIALLAILVVLGRLGLRRRCWQAMTERERLAFLYAGILKKTAKQGLKREPNETPAEFLRRLSLLDYEALRLWTRLTQLVEEGLYGPGDAREELREVQGMLKDIMSLNSKGLLKNVENSF